MTELILTNYSHPALEPLNNIVRLPRKDAFALAARLAEDHKGASFFRFADFENYYALRMAQDKALYDAFVALGGKPQTDHPLSFVVGGSEYLRQWFGGGRITRIRLADLPEACVSFTLGDSGAGCQRTGGVRVLTRAMLLDMADKLDELREKHHYIEAQVWLENIGEEKILHDLSVQPGESLQAAIDALPQDGRPVTLRLAPGVYREKVVLQRPCTTLEGPGAEIVWRDGAKEMLPDGMNRGTFRTATLMVDAPHVTLRGLTIRNAAAPRETVGQAIALYADGDFFTCEDCVLLSCQDTLFTAPLPPKELQKNGFIGPKQFAPRVPQRHTYRRCRIQGDVDFIFGSAAAWFEDCDIVSVAPGYATAASTPEGQRYGYVFSRCRFRSESLPEGSCYLGRPWRDHAKTVLLHCQIGPHIRPEGWHDWGKPPFHAAGYYAEYPAPEGRADFARALTQEEAASYTYEAFMESL